MKELSLRPYGGRLIVAKTAQEYERLHKKLFKNTDVLKSTYEGRFCGEQEKNGLWVYLIWGRGINQIAHEISHVILHLFARCGIDPCGCNGEAFCYMLSQLMQEATGR